MRMRTAVTFVLLLLCCAATRPALAAGADAAQHSRRYVRIETSLGNIDLELYEDQAPKTVRNFLTYIDEKFYDGTIFHRVAHGVVIQGGGFTPDLKEKPVTHHPIANEAANGLLNRRGTIGMARRSDPNSATCQFYINTGDNIALNHLNSTRQGMGYCVFGRVLAGMDVVEKIDAADVDKGEKRGGVRSEPKLYMHDGGEAPSVEIPKQSIVIKSIRELASVASGK